MQDRAGLLERERNVCMETRRSPISICRSVTAAAAVLALLSVPGPAAAIKQGLVAAIQSVIPREQWVPGDLVLVTLPSNTKQTLISGACMGPCFSPDGSRIAVIHNDLVALIGIDGGGLEHTSQQINTAGSAGTCGHPQSAGIALYWIARPDGEYIYWFESGIPGICRSKVGVWQREILDDGVYFWGGFSRDGTRAAATGPQGTLDCWNVKAIDLTGARSWQVHPEYGCNVSVSPDGRYIWHLLNGGGIWGGAEHEYSIIRNWTDGTQVRLIDSHCNHDTNRWSHFDNDILLYHQWDMNNGATCDVAGNFGVVMDLSTDERFNCGADLEPFDFFPTSTDTINSQCGEIGFLPAPGRYNEGQLSVQLTTGTAGASIRYTLNGGTPDSVTGTLLTPGGSVTVSISTFDTVYMRALAYKTGMTPSIVATAAYYGPGLPPFTITAPAAGDIFHVGDTLRVRWTTRDGFVTRSDVGFSVTGEEFITIVNTSVSPTMPEWEDVAWKIPPTINGTSTISSEAIVKVSVYGSGSLYALSAPFSIVPGTAAQLPSKPLAFSGNAPVLYGRGLRIPLDASRSGPWYVDVMELDGTVVYRMGGTAPRTEVFWDGADCNGKRVSSGIHSVTVYQNARRNSWLFSLTR
jgi:hypothetical protein